MCLKYSSQKSCLHIYENYIYGNIRKKSTTCFDKFYILIAYESAYEYILTCCFTFESTVLQEDSNIACLPRPFNKFLAHCTTEKSISNLSLKFGFLILHNRRKKMGWCHWKAELVEWQWQRWIDVKSKGNHCNHVIHFTELTHSF